MTNIADFQHIFNNNEQQGKKLPANVLIITSVDDQEKILSYLSPTNTGSVVFNLNNKTNNDMQTNEKKNNKRTLFHSESEISNDDTKSRNNKRRKGDLTCVICGGSASGYNFNQITCESCKAFFRRNALQPIEKTKCLSQTNNLNEVRCNVRYDVKQKCQRCRLVKCFQAGMRKDHILTPEEKLSKQQRLEANRRIRLSQISNDSDDTKQEVILESPSIYTKCEPIIGMPSTPSYFLAETDRSYLHYIQNSYLSALQSTPSASSVMSFELAPDRMSAYMNTLDIQNFSAVRIINFMRQIPEFEELHENDRLLLVKYNLTLLFLINHALTFDATREIVYEDSLFDVISPTDEAFAQHCKSLFILCYGYEFSRQVMAILHAISELVNKDQIIVPLLLIIMIHLKGLSANDDQEPLLNDNLHVFHVHAKYTDLLFRYLIEKSSFDAAVIKMMRITQVLLKTQGLMRDFHQYMKSKIDINYINPLMKSLLHLT